MADEVVGTAFVRIKALTKGLGKEIEKSVKKGMADANLDKIGEEEGKKLGTSMGDSAVDSASDRIKKRSGDFVSDDLLKNVRKDLDAKGGLFGDFDFIPQGAQDKLRDSLRGQSVMLDGHLDDINANIARKWPKDRDLFNNFGSQSRNAKRESSELGEALDSLGKKMSGLRSNMPSLGGGLTKMFGGVAGLAVAALPYIQDLGAGLLAYGTGIVAQLGFMTTAAVGLAAAAGAARGSALLPILPIMLAFKAESDTLTEFKDSMVAAKEEFMQIGLATQETLLPGLDRAVFQMGELVPMFSEFGSFVGLAVGNFAELAATTLTGAKAQGRFGDILRSSLRILDIILPTVLNLGDILSGLWVAAIPASERFVGSLADMVQHWTDIVNFGLNSGTLTETINTWYDRAQLLGSALGDVAGALFDILSVGGDSADGLFVRFDEWAGRFRAFTESEVGQNKIALIFDNALAVMREVNGVAAELFDGIFGRLDDVGGVDTMVTSLQKLQDIIPGLKEQFQGFVDDIRDLNGVLGPQLKAKIEQTFEELKEPLGRLLHAVLDIMRAMEESGAFEVFLDLLHILADVLTSLLSIPGFGTFIGYMLAFGGAAKIAAIALGPMVSILGPFTSIIGAFLKLKVGHTLGQAAIGLLGFGEAAKKAAAGKAAADALSGVGSAAQAAGTAAKSGGIVGALGKIGPSLSAIGPWGIAAGVGIGAAAAAFHFASKDTKAFEQEVRQLSDALGTVNGGLNVTAEGLQKYILEESRLNSRNQIDDLADMGFTIEGLSDQLERGTLSSQEFADQALRSGQVYLDAFQNAGDGASGIKEVENSLESIQKAYKLTNEQVRELADGSMVYVDGVQLELKGNDDLLESFEELNEVLGKAAKESLDEFALSTQNVRLLGKETLNQMVKDVKDTEDDADAGKRHIENMDALRAAAAANIPTITGLSDAIKDQVLAQSTLADGTVDVIKQEQLLYNEQQKLFKQIRDNFELFSSSNFEIDFGAAKTAIFDFTNVIDQFGLDTKAGFEGFQLTAAFGGLDALVERFPGVGEAAQGMFEQLRGLPVEEFNAAAAAMNVDADSLRDAMNGAQQAIIDLQNKAAERLPRIQEALDSNLKTREDGTQYFDTEGFVRAADQRIAETDQFGKDIEQIREDISIEAARQALEQGPKTARALAHALQTDEDGVKFQLARMQFAEGALRGTVTTLFGPAIAAEYAAKVKPVSDAMGIGLTAGINSPGTLEALKAGGENLLNSLVEGFKGKFVWEGDSVRFVRTGVFRETLRIGGSRIVAGIRRSQGGFVPGGSFNFAGGPRGTDTVPAWLTPGEFVLRQTVAQAIPANVLNSLNAGDPRMISLLSSLGQNRPGSPNAPGVFSAMPPVQTTRGAGNLIIQQMNIEAPTPLESARQVSSRLRILQSQVAQR